MKEDKNRVLLEYRKEINRALVDLRTPGKRHRQIPNVLTVLRMTAPLFIVPSIIIGNLPMTVALISAFSLTDVADGFIARKFHLTSELGKDLDAISDKIFASTLLLSASICNPILLTNLALEGVISLINANKKLHGQEVRSSLVGKAKTWFLFATAGVGLISPYFKVNKTLKPLMLMTTGMQLLTVKSYLKKDKVQKNVVSEKIEIQKKDVLAQKGESKVLKKQKQLKKESVVSDVKDNDLKLQELKEIRELLRPKDESKDHYQKREKVKKIKL